MWFNILLLLCGFAAGAILTVFVLAEAGNHSPRKSRENSKNNGNSASRETREDTGRGRQRN